MARTRTDARGAFFSRIAPLARGDYQAPIILPGREAEILPELLDAAVRTLGRRGVLWWPNLLAESAGLAALRGYLKERNLAWVEEGESAPRLDIGGRSYAEIEKSWTASHRGDVRRQRRRLAEQGTLTLWQPPSVDEALHVLDEFFDVHDAKWLAQGYPGRFADPREREHFRAVLRRMLGGRAHFSVLRCGSTNISYLFGLESGRYIQSYRPTFLPAYANFSPSKVHIALLLEQACERGMAGIDFLLGAEPYKLLWGAELVETVSIYAALSRMSLSYAWFSRAKPYLRGRFAGDLMRLRAFLQRRRGA